MAKSSLTVSGENTPTSPETTLEEEASYVLDYEGAKWVEKQHYESMERRCLFSEDRTEELERLMEEATKTSRVREVNGCAAINREFDKKDMQN